MIKLFERDEDMDAFFASIYDEAHDGEVSVSEFRQNPKMIVNTFKGFVFHDPEYDEINTNMQNAIQASITCIK